MKRLSCPWLRAFGLWLIAEVVQVGEASTGGWLEDIQLSLKTTRFELARSGSDVPNIPVLSVKHVIYGERSFAHSEGHHEDSSFRTRYSSAYGLIPVHVGQRSITIVAPYVSHTRFAFTEGPLHDHDVTGLSLLAGGAAQTGKNTQWGAFVMPSAYSPLTDRADWAYSGVACVAGRYFHGENSVWYYGLFYDYSFSDGYFLPYLGYSYILDTSWTISLIAPWPAINYAPTDSLFFRLGAGLSGSSWAINPKGDESQVVGSVGGWDFGFWAEARIHRSIWMNIGAGWSGLKSFTFKADGDSDFELDFDSEPFVSVAINIRPGML